MHVVVRVDFLPHSEQLVFTKPGPLGSVRAVTVNCSDLMRSTLARLPQVLPRWAEAAFDQDLVFRDAASGEYFAFPKHGVWSGEGLAHEGLNGLLK